MVDSNPSKPQATPATGATPPAAPSPALEATTTRSISRREDKVDYQPRPTRPAWREKLNEGFRTFMWVAPLTALIWIYAERAQIAPLEVTVKVRVVSNSPDRVVTMLSPMDRSVTLDLRAPRAGLDAIRERLTSVREVEVTIPEDIAPGFEGDISITDRIERNPIFQEWAVDVERSFPQVRIKVEKKASRDLPIRPKPEDMSSFANATFDPPTVRIEGPQSYIDRIKPDQVAHADLDKFRAYKSGPYEDMVSVIGFAEENVSKDPPRVKATVEIRSGDKETLNSVGVHVSIPAPQLKALPAVITNPTLPNVEVSGPQAQLARLRGPTPEFVARVNVAIELGDLQQPRFTKRLTAANYVLPPDVTVVNPNREIVFTVEPR